MWIWPKPKGLPARDIKNRYILRPTLPTIITSFALLMIGSVDGRPDLRDHLQLARAGPGAVTRRSGLFDTPVIVGDTVIFSYLLAITVFLLDFIYALVDPRVKIGGEGEP